MLLEGQRKRRHEGCDPNGRLNHRDRQCILMNVVVLTFSYQPGEICEGNAKLVKQRETLLHLIVGEHIPGCSRTTSNKMPKAGPRTL